MRLSLFLLLSAIAHAQWTMQNSGTTAGLRGIHAVDDKIAWASGTEGTILRTTDGGATWTKCATPPEGEKLDFRGVWAERGKPVVTMASGPGAKSRIYEAAETCKSWVLAISNSEKDGFWDSLVIKRGMRPFDKKWEGSILGDPVDLIGSKHFQFVFKVEGGTWYDDHMGCVALANESAFAASNSSMFVFTSSDFLWVTGGIGGPRAVSVQQKRCSGVPLPLTSGSDSGGAFSVYFRDRNHGVVVGGDYKKPNDSAGTAAFTSDGGKTWKASTKLPHGYRSAVQWLEGKTWIAVGTNGSDVSYDDGHTWQSLDNGDWNALSLPYVVGPNGRIAKLDRSAIKPKRQLRP